eukprot:COSAG01_NODE_66438_length_270_cov_0.602339_1_plen_38_part_01
MSLSEVGSGSFNRAGAQPACLCLPGCTSAAYLYLPLRA